MDLNVCRICGGIENLKNIIEHEPEIIEKLSKCANVNIDPSDSLPKLICEQCTHNLEISYRLRKQSEKTQELLRQKLEMTENQQSNKELVSIPESLHVDRKAIENEEVVESFITLSDEEKMEELVEEQIISTKILHIQNLEFDTENPSDLFIDDGESNIDSKQPNESIMAECTIDLLSSPSRSEKNYDRNDVTKNGSSPKYSHVCDTCQNSFPSRKEYNRHIKEHGTERYQCIQCCKFFPTQYRLKRHEEIHSDDHNYQCPHCERTYRGQNNLHRHIKTVHLDGQSFDCNVCYVSFSRKDALKRHMLLHSDEDHVCPICHQSFKTKYYLNAHYKSRHEKNGNRCKRNKQKISNDKKKYQCGYCGKLFKSSFPYTNHIRIHKNEKPHECEGCGKKFRTIAALSIHQRIHDDYRPYQCDVCLKSFKQSSHLNEHKLLHLENVPQHTCSVCQSSFTKKSNLKAHMLIHATEKPFKCAECTAEFTFMHLLQQHANKVHNRVISKEYDLSDTIDLVGADENSNICDETLKEDIIHFINSDTEFESDGEQYLSEDLKTDVEKQQNSNEKYQDSFIDCIHIDSSNSDHSLAINEMHNIESICREEIHITEHKVEVFVNEETKITNTGYDVHHII